MKSGFMKSLKHRLIAGVMAVAMLIAIAVLIPREAVARPHAATGDVAQRIEQLSQRFPNGSFFTANGGRCYHAAGVNACDNCYLLNVMRSMGYPNLMGNAGSWTCVAFARYAFWWIFGIPHNVGAYSGYIPAGTHSVSRANARPGDLFIWNPGERANISGGHMAIYLGGGRVFESNIGSPNQVAHGLYRNGWGAPSLILRANNYDEINRTIPSGPPASIGNGAYQIRSVGSPTRLLNVSAWDTPVANNNVTIFDNHNRYETQVWYASSRGDAYIFRSPVYPLVLNAFNYSPGIGTVINIRPLEANDPTQEWVLLDAGYGEFYILCAYNQHLALTIDSAENSARARLQPLTGDEMQRWIFESYVSANRRMPLVPTPAAGDIGNEYEEYDDIINDAPYEYSAPTSRFADEAPAPAMPTPPPPGTSTIEGYFTHPNPVGTVTIELRYGAADGPLVSYETINLVPANTTIPVRFMFTDMDAGTYSLVFSQPSHTGFIINNVIMPEDGNTVRVSQDPRFPEQLPMYPGNISGSGQINVTDLNILLNNWMRENERVNLTGDGEIDIADLTLMLANWMAEVVVVD